MLTVTQDLMLPTTVVGSWPRPRWFDRQLNGASLSTRMKDVTFREQYTDALAALLSEQERAGLDILTTGDYHHDDLIGGEGWVTYTIERWGGVTGDIHHVLPATVPFPQGSILKEVEAAWQFPRVVGKLEENPDTPVEFAKIWRLAQSRAHKPVMFGTMSSLLYMMLLPIEKGSYYDGNKRELLWDAAGLLNRELHRLADAGCKVIQIEDPLIHAVAWGSPDDKEQLEFFIDAYHREVEGLHEKAEVWIHTCWGNPNMQKGDPTVSYAPSIETYMERIKADVITFESMDDHGKELDLFAAYKDSMNKKIAIGTVSHRTLQVETPQQVADHVRKALNYINPENLVLTSDCGFGRQGSNRMVAFYKSASIALGANIVRRELGFEERYVPIADSGREADGLIHDTAEKTGLFKDFLAS
jgi:5-methyltetrahydropteroyltriglutamate--homocysteine methyltransferase